MLHNTRITEKMIDTGTLINKSRHDVSVLTSRLGSRFVDIAVRPPDVVE